MSAICQTSIGETRIALRARPSHMGSQINYYLQISHPAVIRTTVIHFIGQNQDQALRSFEISRENAIASSQFERLAR